MSRIVTLALVTALGLATSACVSSDQEKPAAAAVPAAPTKPAVAGVLAGALGAKLDEADRETAFDAQLQSLSSGKRQSWRGGKGSYGYIEPGTESGSCRDYSHTVYIAGRPQTGSGSACKDATGNWTVKS